MTHPETIDEVLVAMDRLLDRTVEENDPLGYFTCVYRTVTARIRDGVRDGEFDDDERMERFDVVFAQRFLDAAEQHRTGRAPSRSWRVALSTPRHSVLVLQHVLVGMNAHINLDLGIAAASIQDGDEIAELRGDFDRLNDVLAEMVDRMQEALGRVSPWTDLMDKVCGGLDEEVAGWSIGRARQRAWELAEQLAAQQADHDRIVDGRDRLVALLGGRLLHPVLLSTRIAVAAAARLERPSVRTVAEALLDPA
ncbi:MAG TPA: DUF5995 family protein [Marmoricola sp.]|nr:DUF5995 family protein [Marmoricola sp.]